MPQGHLHLHRKVKLEPGPSRKREPGEGKSEVSWKEDLTSPEPELKVRRTTHLDPVGGPGPAKVVSREFFGGRKALVDAFG